MGVTIGMDKVITPPRHHYRIFISALAVLVLLGVIFVMNRHVRAEESAPASNERIITLHDDGTDKGFITKKSTIREALKEQGIRLDENDRTEPGLDEKFVATSYQINIYRARPVLVRDGATETKIVTSYRTGKQIAAHAKIALRDADRVSLAPSKDPIADGAAEVMTIKRATEFMFNFYGKTETNYTLASTVGDMLREKKINMSTSDGVSPAVETPITPGMTVRLWREGVQTVTVEEPVAHTIKQIKDADRDKGYKNIQTKGENGQRTVTYEIYVQNGVEVSRKEINSNITKRPVEQVEVVGTKVSLPAGSHEDWMAAAGISPSDYGYVNFIFSKESGWRPNAASSNGYYGLGQTNLKSISGACPNWESDPICQIRLFDRYKSRYGSWRDAYDFWVSHRWW